MKRFTFPLERVRHYRFLQLETEQGKLEQLLAKLQTLDQLENDLTRQRLEAEEAVRALTKAGAPVEPAQVCSMTDFRGYLKQVAATLALRRAELSRRVAVQRQELLEARRRYEVLDRFRGREKLRWKAAFDQELEQLAAENFLARWKPA